MPTQSKHDLRSRDTPAPSGLSGTGGPAAGVVKMLLKLPPGGVKGSGQPSASASSLGALVFPEALPSPHSHLRSCGFKHYLGLNSLHVSSTLDPSPKSPTHAINYLLNPSSRLASHMKDIQTFCDVLPPPQPAPQLPPLQTQASRDPCVSCPAPAHQQPILSEHEPSTCTQHPTMSPGPQPRPGPKGTSSCAV